MTNQAATEYRNVPLTALEESTTNPRRVFDEDGLKELAESIRSQGVLSPLLVRPLAEHRFEIVAGARRYRAALLAEAETVPVRIVALTDAQALEAQLIENLQRRDVHPLEEAQGFRALLMLDEPKYSIEQIAAKTGKSPAYCASRIKMTELASVVTEAFAKDEIGIGHALLLAKLQPAEQVEALAACFRNDWNGSSSKTRPILLPVRHLKEWIEQNILLILKDAPFSKSDATLNPAAGSCDDCPKRTGANALLFADIAAGSNLDACTDPACYQAKLDGFVRQTIAAKPKLVQISSAYGTATGDTAALPRNRYVEINTEKPKNEKQRDWPEYKTCKFTTDAIVTEGTEKGELRKICANPECPIHHTRKQKGATDAAFKAEQEKRRREEAIAQATGLRVLKATSDAVPVRLMKRDLLFITERLAAALDERRLAILLRVHGIGNIKKEAPAKLLAPFLRKAEESTLGRVLVEIAVLQTSESAKALREAAEFYKVDVAAITAKVKQEFAEKEKTQAARKATEKAKPSQPRTVAAKKAKAA